MIYYNEFEPYAARWLENLIEAGHLPAGYVDDRSITDVSPSDLKGFISCHFFAGIGGWPLALRMAGWPDDRPVWTGSCPCQPFSAAGNKAGFDDPRHLWPTWFRLIRKLRPGVVFGEQVASPDGLRWLDLVSTDMEDQDYAFGAIDLCAASVGAPQIRQRLWFVGERLERTPRDGREERRAEPSGQSPVARRGLVGLADAGRAGLPEREGDGSLRRETLGTPEGETVVGSGDPDRVALSNGARREPGRIAAKAARYGNSLRAAGGNDRSERAYPNIGWNNPDWLFCTDGKWRSVEPFTFPLAHGIPARVGRLRAYGNAIVPQVAATFIDAYLSNERTL